MEGSFFNDPIMGGISNQLSLVIEKPTKSGLKKLLILVWSEMVENENDLKSRCCGFCNSPFWKTSLQVEKMLPSCFHLSCLGMNKFEKNWRSTDIARVWQKKVGGILFKEGTIGSGIDFSIAGFGEKNWINNDPNFIRWGMFHVS